MRTRRGASDPTTSTRTPIRRPRKSPRQSSDSESLRESDGEGGFGTDENESAGLYRALYDYFDAEARTDLRE
ncbi:hypothetical protein [Halorussus aquaticus]|uniref:Uncharacterized protein n=1 Tax=Halorussus aquaticus TaxID=2953748 RepID=A0ABD5Q7R6_9EURY|nr:hypothetical protein [Halorussus aquaticus]